MMTSALKQREKQHLVSSRRKHRNLDVYRKGLEELTQQLDTLDHMKYDHFETVAQHTRKVWSSVLKRTTLAARAEVDVLEKVSEKGLQNDCLGRMLASTADPFDVVPPPIIDGISKEQPREPYSPLQAN